MIFERTPNEIILKISPNIDKYGLQRITEIIRELELSANSNSNQKDADKLADELNENWWMKNRKRFLK